MNVPRSPRSPVRFAPVKKPDLGRALIGSEIWIVRSFDLMVGRAAIPSPLGVSVPGPAGTRVTLEIEPDPETELHRKARGAKIVVGTFASFSIAIPQLWGSTRLRPADGVFFRVVTLETIELPSGPLRITVELVADGENAVERIDGVRGRV